MKIIYKCCKDICAFVFHSLIVVFMPIIVVLSLVSAAKPTRLQVSICIAFVVFFGKFSKVFIYQASGRYFIMQYRICMYGYSLFVILQSNYWRHS